MNSGLTIRKITAAETPNAVCAICRNRGKLVRATHEVDKTRPVSVCYFACRNHVRTSVRWERVERVSAAYRQQKRAKAKATVKTVKVG